MSDFRIDTGKIFRSETTPEGFLRVWMTVSRTGPLQYRNDNGSQRIEHVSADELFKKESLDTAWGKPIVHHHPPEGTVTPNNSRQYQRGMTMQNSAVVNDKFLTIVGVLTDGEAIESVKRGDDEVSAGYWTDLKPRGDGDFNQTNRRYNHFAFLPNGRAGKDVRIHLDGDGEERGNVWRCDAVTEDDFQHEGQMSETTRKVNLDGVDFEVPPDLATAVAGLKKRVDTAETTSAQLKADKSSLEGQLAAAQTKLDEANAQRLDTDAIASEIQQRLDAWTEVLPALRQDKTDYRPDYKLDAIAIKSLYLKTCKGQNLDGKDAAYIEGMYEGLKPLPTDRRTDARAVTDTALAFLNASADADSGGGDGNSIDQAREAQRHRLESAYKGGGN